MWARPGWSGQLKKVRDASYETGVTRFGLNVLANELLNSRTTKSSWNAERRLGVSNLVTSVRNIRLGHGMVDGVACYLFSKTIIGCGYNSPEEMILWKEWCARPYCGMRRARRRCRGRRREGERQAGSTFGDRSTVVGGVVVEEEEGS